MKIYIVHYYNRDAEVSEVAMVTQEFEAAKATILDIEQIPDFKGWLLYVDENVTTFLEEATGDKYQITEWEVL